MIKLKHGCCLERMKEIPDKSIDMVLCDPPYGTTACKWDNIVPFEPMWAELERIVKPNGAILLFGKEPFSSMLRHSSLKTFKYDWVWKKNRPVGFTNAKLKPLCSFEIISVFSSGKTSNGNPNNMRYTPQGLIKVDRKGTTSGNKHGQNSYARPSHKAYIQEFTNYPIDIIEVDETHLGRKLHPTQKPVPLLEYFIKTYTLEGETVLDFTMGSGSTGVACKNLNRNFIGIEKDKNWFNIAKQRIVDAIKLKKKGGENMTAETTKKAPAKKAAASKKVAKKVVAKKATTKKATKKTATKKAAKKA